MTMLDDFLADIEAICADLPEPSGHGRVHAPEALVEYLHPEKEH